MTKNYKRGLGLSESRGFTLIELLVVIAIIGILASIILASLATARSKGNNASVESELQSIQQQAELDNSGGFYAYPAGGSAISTAIVGTSLCASTTNSVFADPKIMQIITGAMSNAAASISACAETSGGSAWAVAVPLATDKALAWCVDSSGSSKQEGTAGGTALTQATLGAFTAGGSGATCL